MEKTIYSERHTRLIQRLRQARKTKKLTQAQAGKLSQCSRCWIQKMESGQLRVDVVQLRELCHAYGLDFIALMREMDRD